MPTFSVGAEVAPKKTTSIDYLETARIICEFEGFEPNRYQDLSGGGYVIGCGHAAKGRKTITRAHSLSIVAQEVERLAPKIHDAYGKVSQDQFNGIASILYNTPRYGSIVKSPMLVGMVKRGERYGVEQYFENQIRAMEAHTGKKLGGLRTRRESEISFIF